MIRMEKNDVCIIGGGLSGLSAAHELSERLGEQLNITIIEKEPELGGRIFSKSFNGIPIELGAQFFVDKGIVFNLVNTLGLSFYSLDDDFISFYKDGKLNSRAKLSSSKFLGRKGESEIVKLIDYLKNVEEQKSLRCINFHEWYKENIGTELLSFWNRLLISIGVRDIKSINAQFGLILINVFYGRNYLLKDGMQKLISKLEEIIKLKNVEILKDTGCKNIEKKDGKFLVVYERNGEIKERYFHKIISAIKPEDLIEIFHDGSYKELEKIDGHPMNLYVVDSNIKLWDKTWGVIVLDEESPIYAICDWGNIVEESKNIPILLICSPFASKKEILSEIRRLFPKSNLKLNIIFEKKWDVGLHQPGSQIYQIRKSILGNLPKGFYMAGDWTILPALEGAVVSGIRSAELLIREL